MSKRMRAVRKSIASSSAVSRLDQQRRQLRLVEQPCHIAIARAIPAAAAAVSKQHNSSRSRGQAQITLQRHHARRDVD
jgi:hypothetical protein